MPSLPAQVRPFPIYPVLHVQVNEPGSLPHAALASQGLPSHSSSSEEKGKGLKLGNLYPVYS